MSSRYPPYPPSPSTQTSNPNVPPFSSGPGDKFSADSKQFIDKFGNGDTLSKFSVDTKFGGHGIDASGMSSGGNGNLGKRGSGNRARSVDDEDVDGDAAALNATETSALTSQTLNTDGTPKRPMNAFMIFARRRRPQVSSENQAMRTGEISKILSREWNTMEGSEKQFYLDQAKLLKENFNAKYPDYVYRRRPNNSRKRRKPDGSLAGRAGASRDSIDDGPGNGNDMSEPSPSDHGDDDHNSHHVFPPPPSRAAAADYAPYGSGNTQHSTSSARYGAYGHNAHGGHGGYLDHDVPSPTTNTNPNSRFSYSSSSSGPPPSSASSDSHHRRLSQPPPPPFSSSSTSGSGAGRYPPYAHSPNLYNPAAPNNSGPNPSSGDRWPGGPGERPRSSSNSHAWAQQQQDRTLAKPFWSGPGSGPGSSHSHSPVDGASANNSNHNPTNDSFTFPTLTSPFFPDSTGPSSSNAPSSGGPPNSAGGAGSGAGNAYPGPPPSSAHSYSSHPRYDAVSRQSYSGNVSSPSLSPTINNPYPGSAGGPTGSANDHMYARGSAGGRVLPPISGYAGPGGAPPTSGGGPSGDFWKDKDEH